MFRFFYSTLLTVLYEWLFHKNATRVDDAPSGELAAEFRAPRHPNDE
jgi:hypothetical protein